jgi:putative FmdB family regulatory protein
MPIYEYQCKACEHVFDVLQKMSDDPLTYCPECGEPELRKLLSAPNFRLKGGGWYETDFKDKNKRNLADGGDSASSAGSDSSSKSSSDSSSKSSSNSSSKSSSKSSDSSSSTD